MNASEKLAEAKSIADSNPTRTQLEALNFSTIALVAHEKGYKFSSIESRDQYYALPDAQKKETLISFILS